MGTGGCPRLIISQHRYNKQDFCVSDVPQNTSPGPDCTILAITNQQFVTLGFFGHALYFSRLARLRNLQLVSVGTIMPLPCYSLILDFQEVWEHPLKNVIFAYYVISSFTHLALTIFTPLFAISTTTTFGAFTDVRDLCEHQEITSKRIYKVGPRLSSQNGVNFYSY